MTDEEAFALQAYGGLLEFAMATYERMVEVKRTPKTEMERHTKVIAEGFISMGPDMLKACEHFGLERNHNKKHPRWKFNVRVQSLLKALLLSGASPATIVTGYLQELDERRAKRK